MLKEMVEMVENFTPDEREFVRDAYREFFKLFNCFKCPVINSREFYDFVFKKQGEPGCKICHGFPSLMPDHEVMCPCDNLGKEESYKRLEELIESWE